MTPHSAKLPEYEPIPENLNLTLLQVVHRHGERTPVRSRLESIIPATWNLCDANCAMFATILDFNEQQGISNEGIPSKYMPLQRLIEKKTSEGQYKTHSPGACYFGQLTNLGRNSLNSLGARLREIYIDKLNFLPDEFDEKMIYIRSTDYPRTQESVQQMIAGGLYPPSKRNNGDTLQIRIRDPRDENMYSNPNCYKLRYMAKEFHKTVADIYKDQFVSLSKRLKKYVDDVSLDSHPSANGIFDTVVAAKVHGFDLPEEFDDQLIEDLEQIVVSEWFYGHIHNNEFRRLGLGRLAGEIRDRMVHRVDGTDKKNNEDYKLAVYSGHDTTIAPLLIILGGYNSRWPPFGSSIIFELYKSNKGKGGWFSKKKEDHFVRVRFNNQVLRLPGCAEKGKHHSNGDQSFCTLEAFKKIVEDQVPADWTAECNI
ncbi:unnamed protein product [Cunninghamella blakesleeana]